MPSLLGVTVKVLWAQQGYTVRSGTVDKVVQEFEGGLFCLEKLPTAPRYVDCWRVSKGQALRRCYMGLKSDWMLTLSGVHACLHGEEVLTLDYFFFTKWHVMCINIH